MRSFFFRNKRITWTMYLPVASSDCHLRHDNNHDTVLNYRFFFISLIAACSQPVITHCNIQLILTKIGWNTALRWDQYRQRTHEHSLNVFQFLHACSLLLHSREIICSSLMPWFSTFLAPPKIFPSTLKHSTCCPSSVLLRPVSRK